MATSTQTRLTADALAEQFYARGLAGRMLTAKQTAFIRSLWLRENPGVPSSEVGGTGHTPDGQVFTWVVGHPAGGNRRSNLSAVFTVYAACGRCRRTHAIGRPC